MRVLAVRNIVAPASTYLLSRLNEVPGCELLVVYESTTESNREWPLPPELPFQNRILSSRTLDLRNLVSDAYVHIPRGAWKVLSEFRPDVVLAGGGVWTSPTNALALLGRAQGKWRFVPWWASFGRSPASLGRRLAWPWIRAFVASGDAWLAYGQRAARDVVGLGADPMRTIVSPNVAVPLTPPIPRRSRREDAPTRFLFVGQLIARKGVEVLLDAFARTRDGELWIAGNGPLREQVEQAQVHDRRIRFLGHASAADLAELYGEADALVLPALYEPWGLVVNEALSAGLPVIVSDRVGATDDLVVPDVNGLVVKAGAPHELAQAMERLAGWSQAKREQAAAENHRLLEGWTVDIAVERILVAAHIAMTRKSCVS